MLEGSDESLPQACEKCTPIWGNIHPPSSFSKTWIWLLCYYWDHLGRGDLYFKLWPFTARYQLFTLFNCHSAILLLLWLYFFSHLYAQFLNWALHMCTAQSWDILRLRHSVPIYSDYISGVGHTLLHGVEYMPQRLFWSMLCNSTPLHITWVLSAFILVY